MSSGGVETEGQLGDGAASLWATRGGGGWRSAHDDGGPFLLVTKGEYAGMSIGTQTARWVAVFYGGGAVR